MALVLQTGDENAGQRISIPVPGRSTPLVVTPVTGGGGAVAPLSNVLYVDGGTATAPGDQDGSDDAPFSTLTAAVASLDGSLLPEAVILMVPGDYSGEAAVVSTYTGTLVIQGITVGPINQIGTTIPALTCDVLYISNVKTGVVTCGVLFADGVNFNGDVTCAAFLEAYRTNFDELLEVTLAQDVFLDDCTLTSLEATDGIVTAVHCTFDDIVGATSLIAESCIFTGNAAVVGAADLNLCTFETETALTLTTLVGSKFENITFNGVGLALDFDDGAAGEGTLLIDQASIASWIAATISITLGGVQVLDAPREELRWGANAATDNEFLQPWQNGNPSSGTAAERWQGVTRGYLATQLRVQLQTAVATDLTITLYKAGTLAGLAATTLLLTLPASSNYATFDLNTELLSVLPGEYLAVRYDSAAGLAVPIEVSVVLN